MLKGNRRVAVIVAGIIGVVGVTLVGPYVSAPVETVLPAQGVIATLCGLHQFSANEGTE